MGDVWAGCISKVHWTNKSYHQSLWLSQRRMMHLELWASSCQQSGLYQQHRHSVFHRCLQLGAVAMVHPSVGHIYLHVWVWVWLHCTSWCWSQLVSTSWCWSQLVSTSRQCCHQWVTVVLWLNRPPLSIYKYLIGWSVVWARAYCHAIVLQSSHSTGLKSVGCVHVCKLVSAWHTTQPNYCLVHRRLSSNSGWDHNIL